MGAGAKPVKSSGWASGRNGDAVSGCDGWDAGRNRCSDIQRLLRHRKPSFPVGARSLRCVATRGWPVKSCNTSDRASGVTFTHPQTGDRCDVIRRPEKIRAVSAPVIMDWARRLSVAKKNVKATVTMAPPNKTNHTIPGTMPAATTSRALRAWVTTSSWRSASVRSAAPRRSVGRNASRVE